MKKSMYLLILIFFVCFFSINMSIVTYALTPSEELAQIQKAIKEKGAKWTAGLTNIARLPEAAQKELLGIKGSRLFCPYVPRKIAFGKEVNAIPASFDWRSKGKVTSVKDQTNKCGSCWAFAAIAVMESSIMIKKGGSIDLSEQFLISCSNENYGCDGGYQDKTAEFLKKTGTVDEGCFHYTASDVSCEKKCSDWASRIKKIASWGCSESNPESIKQDLYTHGPLYASMVVYDDFFYYKSGIYEHVWGEDGGGHAIAIVGYNSTDKYWICKNSWGSSGWGEGGYFKIKWNDDSNVEDKVIWMDAAN